MGLVVIDGDIVAFRCAAACEKRSVVATHNTTLDQLEFDTMTEFKTFIADDDKLDIKDFTIVPKRVPEPVANALQAVKTTILNIVKAAKCDSYHVVLSGKDNFRLQLPLPTQYKNNRADLDRPVLLQECRDYLIKFHDAEVSEGCEADDILVSYMHQGYINKEYVVQASIDKDALHGAGWVYDWTTMDEPELIEGFGSLYISDNKSGTVKGKGRAFLWCQLLLGDSIDGYKPCELAKVRFGQMWAYKILKDCTNDKQALQAVVDQYKEWYPEPVTYYAWNGVKHTKTWKELMQLYADCCFMRRWEGDRLDIEKVIKKLGVTE